MPNRAALPCNRPLCPGILQDGVCTRCGAAQRPKWPENRYKVAGIPVTIVAGPPGSGKTTYVREHMVQGDLIVDVDAIYVALSGLGWYDKPVGLLPFVIAARDAVIMQLAEESEVKRAWIITSEPNVHKLKQMKEDLQADKLLLLDVSPDECYRRIASDERRADKAQQQRQLVDNWFKKHGRPSKA